MEKIVKAKKLLLTSILILMIIIISGAKSVQAATLETPIYFGIQEFRTGTTPENMAYSIRNPEANGSTPETMVAAKIWDIVKHESNNESSNYSEGNYYCVRAGVGFSDTSKIATYTNSYDFISEKSAISSLGNSNLTSIVADGHYEKLIALIDLLYLKGESTEENRTALKQAAGITDGDYTIDLTEDDFEAVQQAAIWYFTNYDDETYANVYDNLEKTSWLFYNTEERAANSESYTSLSDYAPAVTEAGEQCGEGLQRQAQAELLYKYLIETAETNSADYANGTTIPKNKITLYTNNSVQNTQPIILVEKGEEKDFDLALRKYITKVDGTALTNTRVPNIDTSKLNTTQNEETVTTATYSHRKDAVEVSTDSLVTYNISVYNEGEKKGYATTIVDQLPIGLKLKDELNGTSITSKKGNTYRINYDSSTNKITFTLDEEETVTALNAYGTDLDSDTIEFDCIVTASPDTQNTKVLTNVAWIAEEYDAEDKITITNQEGKDRDSEPSTIPTVNKENMSSYKGKSTNKTDLTDSTYHYEGEQDDDDFEKLVINPKAFDLKLLKRITAVNSTTVNNRITSVDVTGLANGTATTATYKMEKDPVAVKKGDIVTYTFRIYNEGEIDGYASEITENIPSGLQFIYSELTDEELEANTTLTIEEKTAIKYNRTMSWAYSDATLSKISTDYLAKGKGAEIETEGANLIKAFDKTKEYTNTVNDKNPDYKEVSVMLKVTSEDTTATIIRNEAAITGDTDSEGEDVTDRDSTPEDWNKENSNKYYDDNNKWPVYEEDDEDYDNIKLESFDLALRKFIIAVSSDETIEESEYLKNTDGTYTRAPIVDTSKLNTTENGTKITTATYNHPKTPVEVNKGDTVVYMLRVYNEGEIDGYASEITDQLPEYLEFVEGTYNTNYGWTLDTTDTTNRTVKTTYLADSIISKTSTEDGNIVLSYKEVPIMCKVTDTAKAGENITNIAEITESKDENKNIATDRDSTTDNVKLPTDENLPKYKEDETGEYVPGQEDDDDFEKIVVKKFDLALRKFITGVNEKEVTSRIPELSYDSANNQITYNHTKEPVEVINGDTVIYTIRVFNEGEVSGYASEITDDLPEGIEYLPESELNKEYRWVMYDSEGNETTEVSKAVKITTDYLSKEQGEARMQENSNITENPALLTAFDTSKGITDTNPDYADVQIAFKVTEPNTSEKILINSAQISDDTDEDGNPVEDIDSVPDEWNEGEDDQDKEYIKLTYFDLALRKWVTQAIVIEDGSETITETGHKAEDDPEGVVKVEINRKKLDSIVVKFRYSIRITNEGKIAGYAKEITDYVPEGLKFVAEDNKGWTDEGNNVISTRLLEDRLLQPGESAEVTVLLTWINGSNNLGLKTNIAEISEDYNDKGVPDIDSTPDNKVPGEDDIDDAPVLLSITTGVAKTYITLGMVILVTIGSGVVLIKRFVL